MFNDKKFYEKNTKEVYAISRALNREINDAIESITRNCVTIADFEAKQSEVDFRVRKIVTRYEGKLNRYMGKQLNNVVPSEAFTHDQRFKDKVKYENDVKEENFI